MTKRMLIDAVQPEEIRVAITEHTTLEAFDFEGFHKQNMRGNVYLAKVVRVEPSLQAAFVDYGADRHGFLPFSEIHPDYFRIPVSDREALAKQMAESEEELMLDENGEISINGSFADDIEAEFEIEVSGGSSLSLGDVVATDHQDGDPEGGDADDHDDFMTHQTSSRTSEKRPQSPYRQYKIQEVIAKGQILLLQVVKEERGQKGAAMTSYISLAGRYCVLMPNSRKAGGISRKISSAAHRKRLKTIVESLGIEHPMGLIVRTAGQERTKTELKRDCEYLKRLWNDIRTKTMDSVAPFLIHQEGNLIQKSIRDVYSKEISEVLVQGHDGYIEARAMMKTFMPSHVKNVKEYKGERSLLEEHQVDAQIDELYSPTVTLPSGGSLVINPTEALTAIDINSGKSTRDRHIDDTALRTNLEAATEIARQLRLRDIAGLIVIDFIDMETKAHITAVEKKMKEALAQDRSRIQAGHISQFGLFEMSRQRMRPSFFESSTQACTHCSGRGLIRSADSQALQILRMLDKHKPLGDTPIKVFTRTAVASYILNAKRKALLALEEKHGRAVEIHNDDSLGATLCRIENMEIIPPEIRPSPPRKRLPRKVEPGENRHKPHESKPLDDKSEASRKRTRRSRGVKPDSPSTPPHAAPAVKSPPASTPQPTSEADAPAVEGEKKSPRRRRSRNRSRHQEGNKHHGDAQEKAAPTGNDAASAPENPVARSIEKPAIAPSPASASAEASKSVPVTTPVKKKETAKKKGWFGRILTPKETPAQ